MCGISMKDRKTSEAVRKLIGVEPITNVNRSGRLRWYGHVIRKNDEDWMKNVWKSELKAEGRLEDQERQG